MGTAEERSSSLNGTTSVERRILLIEDSTVLSRRLVDLLSEPGRIAVAAQAATQTDAVSRLQEARVAPPREKTRSLTVSS